MKKIKALLIVFFLALSVPVLAESSFKDERPDKVDEVHEEKKDIYRDAPEEEAKAFPDRSDDKKRDEISLDKHEELELKTDHAGPDDKKWENTREDNHDRKDPIAHREDLDDKEKDKVSREKHDEKESAIRHDNHDRKESVAHQERPDSKKKDKAVPEKHDRQDSVTHHDKTDEKGRYRYDYGGKKREIPDSKRYEKRRDNEKNVRRDRRYRNQGNKYDYKNKQKPQGKAYGYYKNKNKGNKNKRRK